MNLSNLHVSITDDDRARVVASGTDEAPVLIFGSLVIDAHSPEAARKFADAAAEFATEAERAGDQR